MQYIYIYREREREREKERERWQKLEREREGWQKLERERYRERERGGRNCAGSRPLSPILHPSTIINLLNLSS